jgi:DNA polymerase V
VSAKALEALTDIFKSGYAYKKIGVIISDFVNEDEVQTDLFSSVNKEVDEGLMGLIDSINKKEGKGTLSFGMASKLNTKQRVKGKALGNINQSPRYVSGWNEIASAL